MKVSPLILADTEAPGDLSRIVNALEIAKESQEAAARYWLSESSRRTHHS